ncbi:MAG: HAMP domain-containing protein, partial [Termitinemataceae bacterium]
MKERKLNAQIQRTSLLVTLISILCVQALLLVLVSVAMGNNLKARAERTASEMAAFLRDPLYNIDDTHAKNMGEALFSSGSLSYLRIESTASGLLFEAGSQNRGKFPVYREIYYDDIPVGTLHLSFSDREMVSFVGLLFLFSLIVLITVFAATILAHKYLVADRILQPIHRLLRGLEEIAMGKLDTRLTTTEFTELNLLVHGINEMAEKIQQKNSELLELNATLEQRVVERTEAVQLALEELKRTQDRLLKSEKLGTLGQLAAGIAHELNTPLGAIIASNQQIKELMDVKLESIADFTRTLDEQGRSLFSELFHQGLQGLTMLEEPSPGITVIRHLENQLRQADISEAETIAEELGSLGIVKVDDTLLELLRHPNSMQIVFWVSTFVNIRKMIAVIDIASQKAAIVVSALRSYLQAGSDERQGLVDIQENFDHILTLMHNLIRRGVVLKRIRGPALVQGSAEKLGQVWMNLIKNSLEAM